MIAPKDNHRGKNPEADGEQPSDAGSSPDSVARAASRLPEYLSSISLVAYRTYSDLEAISYTTWHVSGKEPQDDWHDLDPVLLRRTEQYLHARSAGRTPNGPLQDAWEWFYQTHNPLVVKVVGRACLSDSDAVDCVQEVWMTIIRSIVESKYNPRQGRFSRWLSRLARNRLIDFIRAANRSSNVLPGDLQHVACCRNLPPHEALERQETRQLVHEMLALLEDRTSAENCHIIHGMWLRGDAVSEIADELGLTHEQVWYRHRRTKAHLKRLLKVNGLGS